mmetsp:Transcript_64274/g.150957  ORF Transcript_64274/g.150957 Transcript_64274/m.150957 type:complete len:327 (+) Transcript_64274:716-1696(+)
MLRGIQSVEGGMVQVRIQGLHVLRRHRNCMHDNQDALVHCDGCGAALQVPEVGLAARNEQRLGTLLFDLHLSHRANFDGIAQGRPCAVALPDRRLRRTHLRFPKCAPDALFLGRAVGGGHTGTSSVLADLRAAEEGDPLFLEGPILDNEGRRPVATIVAVGRGVEGEAPAARRKHVRRTAVDEGANSQRQPRAHSKVPLQGIPPLLQEVDLAQVGGHQGGGAGRVACVTSAFQVKDVVEAVRNDGQLVVRGHTCRHGHLRPLLLVQTNRHRGVCGLGVRNLLGQPDLQRGQVAHLHDLSVHRVHALGLHVGNLEDLVVKKLHSILN